MSIQSIGTAAGNGSTLTITATANVATGAAIVVLAGSANTPVGGTTGTGWTQAPLTAVTDSSSNAYTVFDADGNLTYEPQAAACVSTTGALTSGTSTISLTFAQSDNHTAEAFEIT